MRISALQAEASGDQTRTELDSHTDTCVLGDNVLIIEDFERPVEVSGYLFADGTRKCKTETGVIEFEDPKDGSLHYLVVCQAISMPGLQNNLLCPMQLSLNDVLVNEQFKFLSPEPTEKMHATATIPKELDSSSFTTLTNTITTLQRQESKAIDRC